MHLPRTVHSAYPQPLAMVHGASGPSILGSDGGD